MNGNFLLDTNIVIALIAKDENVAQQIANSSVCVPVIVIAELLSGARKSGRVEANVKRAEEFADTNVVLNCDLETAKLFAQTKDNLRRAGKPIPEHDIWIAALALQHGLVLVTRDAHFGEVDGLTVERW